MIAALLDKASCGSGSRSTPLPFQFLDNATIPSGGASPFHVYLQAVSSVGASCGATEQAAGSGRMRKRRRRRITPELGGYGEEWQEREPRRRPGKSQAESH